MESCRSKESLPKEDLLFPVPLSLRPLTSIDQISTTKPLYSFTLPDCNTFIGAIFFLLIDPFRKQQKRHRIEKELDLFGAPLWDNNMHLHKLKNILKKTKKDIYIQQSLPALSEQDMEKKKDY